MKEVPLGKTARELLGKVEEREKEPAGFFYNQANLDRLLNGSQPEEKPPFASMLEAEVKKAMGSAGYEENKIKLLTAVGSPAKFDALVEFPADQDAHSDRVYLSLTGGKIGLNKKRVVFNFDQDVDPVADVGSDQFGAKITEVSIRTILKIMSGLAPNKDKYSVLGNYVLENVPKVVSGLKAANKSDEGVAVIGDIIKEAQMLDSGLALELVKKLKAMSLENQ